MTPLLLYAFGPSLTSLGARVDFIAYPAVHYGSMRHKFSLFDQYTQYVCRCTFDNTMNLCLFTVSSISFIVSLIHRVISPLFDATSILVKHRKHLIGYYRPIIDRQKCLAHLLLDFT